MHVFGGAGGAPPALDSSEPLQFGSHEASPFVGICSHADGPGHVEDWPDGVWLMRQMYVHPPDDPPVGAGGAAVDGGLELGLASSSEPLQLGSQETSPFVGICSHAEEPGHVDD